MTHGNDEDGALSIVV
jgi:hypothetical protein